MPVLLVLGGGLIVRGILGLLTKGKNPKAVGQLPKKSRDGATISQLGRPDGSQLRVECYGREDAPPIILTHGWGANSTEWDYLKKELSDAFRLIVWDLPGLGLCAKPAPIKNTFWRISLATFTDTASSAPTIPSMAQGLIHGNFFLTHRPKICNDR